MAQSYPTYNLDAASVTARNAEYADTPLTDVPGDGSYADPPLGGNRAGSNAPGIGINTGGAQANPTLENWTIEDQAEAARTPQDSQHIGGDGLGAGDATVNPINCIVDPNGTPDINETVSFIAAVVQAAPGAGMGAAAADPVNRGDKTVEIGERAWGTNTVA